MELKIRISHSFLLLILVASATGHGLKVAIIYISIFVHEIAHAIVTKMLGGKVYYLKLLAVGVKISINESYCSNINKIAIYSIGPISNFFLTGLCYILKGSLLNEIIDFDFLIFVNIYLAVFNLIPILPLDGGKILREIFVFSMGIIDAERCTRNISVFIMIVFTAIIVIQTRLNKINYSFILIAIYIFLNLLSRGRSVSAVNIKNILLRKSRILKKGIYPVREVVALKNISLGEIIKRLDFDKFHFINIVDSDLKIIKTISEQDIIDGAIKYNINTTLEELIECKEESKND